MLRAGVLCVLAVFALGRVALAQVKKPGLPPGRDPGGVAIALLSTGIDYTLPEVAARLARDGEGELIGWDTTDRDNRPFAQRSAARPNWGADGTLLARLIGSPGTRLVPVRIDPAEPVSLAHAVAFVAATPARIVVVPMSSAAKADWEPFRQAASRFSDLLFIVAAGDEGKDIAREPVWPAAFGLANVLVVTAPGDGGQHADHAPNGGALVDALVSDTRASGGGDGEAALPQNATSLAAVRAADALAGCWPQLIAAYSGKALKAALLRASTQPTPAPGKPVIAPCAHGPSPR
jgi:hypothetical protein